MDVDVGWLHMFRVDLPKLTSPNRAVNDGRNFIQVFRET